MSKWNEGAFVGVTKTASVCQAQSLSSLPFAPPSPPRRGCSLEAERVEATRIWHAAEPLAVVLRGDGRATDDEQAAPPDAEEEEG